MKIVIALVLLIAVASAAHLYDEDQNTGAAQPAVTSQRAPSYVIKSTRYSYFELDGVGNLVHAVSNKVARSEKFYEFFRQIAVERTAIIVRGDADPTNRQSLYLM